MITLGMFLWGAVTYTSNIDLAKLSSEWERSSWCFLVQRDSQLTQDSNNFSISGDMLSEVQEIFYNGQVVGKRNIELKTEVSEKKFEINFQADASLVTHESRSNSTCTIYYDVIKTTNQRHLLQAHAMLKIPQDVWAIKVKHKLQNSTNEPVEIKLFNDDYQDGKLIKQRMKDYVSTNDISYFLVNPSNIDFDNFVYIDVNRFSRSSYAENFSFSFDIEYLTANDCWNILHGQSITDAIRSVGFNQGHVAAMDKLTCMLTPSVIQQTIRDISIFNISELFDSLTEIEKEVSENRPDVGQKEYFEVLDFMLATTNRVRFYYAYELLKDLMSLMMLDSTGSRDIYRFFTLGKYNGIYPVGPIYAIRDILNKSEITSQDKELLHRLHRDILSKEIIQGINYVKEIPYTNFISRNLTDNLLFYSEELLDDYLTLDTHINKWVEGEDFVDYLKEDIFNLLVATNDYHQAWSNFSASLNKNLIVSYYQLRESMEKIYLVEVKSLSKYVDEYFKQYFENDEFREIRVGNRKFNTVDEFIIEFDRLLMEL